MTNAHRSCLKRWLDHCRTLSSTYTFPFATTPNTNLGGLDYLLDEPLSTGDASKHLRWHALSPCRDCSCGLIGLMWIGRANLKQGALLVGFQFCTAISSST